MRDRDPTLWPSGAELAPSAVKKLLLGIQYEMLLATVRSTLITYSFLTWSHLSSDGELNPIDTGCEAWLC